MDKEAEAIISRLDKLIEQQQLTNSLIAMRNLDYELQKKMRYLLEWQSIENAPEYVGNIPERKERLIIRDVYRIIDS